MDKVIKNYEEVLTKPPTTRLFIKSLKHKYDVNRQYKKHLKEEKKHNHNDDHVNIPPEGIDIITLAIVLDGVVVELMNVQKEFGLLLERNPQFIIIKEGEHRPHQGWVYRNGNFISVEDLGADSHLTRRV